MTPTQDSTTTENWKKYVNKIRLPNDTTQSRTTIRRHSRTTNQSRPPHKTHATTTQKSKSTQNFTSKEKKLNATHVTFTGRPHQTSGALKTRPPRRTSHRLYKGNVFQLTFTDCLMSVVARRQLKESTLTFLIASFGKQKKVP